MGAKEKFKSLIHSKIDSFLDETISQAGISEISMRNYAIRQEYMERIAEINKYGKDRNGETKSFGVICDLAAINKLSNEMINKIIYGRD